MAKNDSNPQESVEPVPVTVLPPAPAKLDPKALGYTGSFTERATRRKFARKVVESDAKPHKLLTVDHGENSNDDRALYHELSEDEFRNLFDKD